MKTSNKFLTSGLALFLTMILAGMIYAKRHIKLTALDRNAAMTTDQKNLEPYHAIHVTGNYEVTLEPGNPHLRIEGTKEEVHNLLAEVKDGILYLSPSNTNDNDIGSDQKIQVQYQSLDEIYLTGNGNIKAENPIQTTGFEINLIGNGDINTHIISDNIKVQLTGNGNIRNEGSSKMLAINLLGNGDIDFKDSETAETKINLTGQGDIRIHCTTKITGNLTGNGRVIYSGEPVIQVDQIGNGEIEKDTEL
ncbi:MAG: head GIN domain-containing protein [Saprospiraceae bacterium]